MQPTKITIVRATGLAAIIGLLCGASPSPVARGHVVGIGGVFVRSANPGRLAAWYRDVLGIALEPWGGALLRYDAPGHPSVAVWNAFPLKNSQFAPSKRQFMINFAVDDLDAILIRLAKKGVTITDRQQDENGRFAGIIDPDGTKIELWEPKR